MTLKKFLKEKLSSEELSQVPTAFDIIGNKERAVAIIEIPDALKKRRKIIAKALMEKHKNIKTVLEKKSPRKGVFRIRSYRILAGEKNTEVLHKESGCIFKLDPRKVYFSQREGTERLRIAGIISKHEKIMVFFAGIGVFPIIISKKGGAETTGIEINPAAIKYFKENAKLNKTDIRILKGDVKKVLLKEKYDRVIMPLPESSVDFIKEALQCLKKGGICHIYLFSETNELDKNIEKIKRIVERFGRTFELLGTQKVLPWGPKTYKTRIDFRVC